MSSCFPHFAIVLFGVVRNKGLRRSSDAEILGSHFLASDWLGIFGALTSVDWSFLFIMEQKYVPSLFTHGNIVKLNVVVS